MGISAERKPRRAPCSPGTRTSPEIGGETTTAMCSIINDTPAGERGPRSRCAPDRIRAIVRRPGPDDSCAATR